MCFPWLFPLGQGDPTNPARPIQVPEVRAFEHLIRYKDGRFARDPFFVFWALNRLQRHQANNNASYYVNIQEGSGLSNMTVDELAAMARDQPNKLQKHITKVLARMRGTDAYWRREGEKLMALFVDAGPPTFFITLTSADDQWPELHQLIAGSNMTSNTAAQRRSNVINNPHLADEYFYHRATTFIQHFFHDTLQAKWHWWRVEWQARGSIHLHGCLRLEHAPELTDLSSIALLGRIAQIELLYRTQLPWTEEFQKTQELPSQQQWEVWRLEQPRMDVLDMEALEQLISDGQAAESTITAFADKFTTAIHPQPPAAHSSTPSAKPHPSSIPYDPTMSDEQRIADLVACMPEHISETHQVLIRILSEAKQSPQKQSHRRRSNSTHIM